MQHALPKPPQLLAAIDLGSNSFHMVIASILHGEVRVQESLSEKVQLGAGLDEYGYLTPEAQDSAMECLGRFAQRIRDIPRGSVRAVGTNTLRLARNSRSFLAKAELILGHDIEVVAGREEARLIYLGVSHFSPDYGGHRLVVDIGGGSTEVIIGEGFEAIATESLYLGCVHFAQRFFPQGLLTEKAFDRAVMTAQQEVVPIQAAYRSIDWNQAIGASGTIKSIAQAGCDGGWSDGAITSTVLQKLRKKLLRASHVDAIDIKGLKEDRRSIFAPGLAILTGIFKQLSIDTMTVSSGALREGVLYDQMGRLSHEDVRDRSIQALMARQHADQGQAQRVEQTAVSFLEQARTDWQLQEPFHIDGLRWAALLHEIGLSVSHSQFHKHGAYLVKHSDLPGFSHQEQQMIALLVRGHRRRIPLDLFKELPREDQTPGLRLCLLLRLAIRLHHARTENTALPVKLCAKGSTLTLSFPDDWLSGHPLTQADLEQEQAYFSAAGYELIIH